MFCSANVLKNSPPMAKAGIVFCLLPIFTSCIIYIDRASFGSNPKICDVTVNYTHNAKGESLTNVTAVTHVNVTKLFVYVSFRVPENENDREYRRELIRTVVDVEKVLNGLQSNPVVKGYVDNILKYVDFEVKFPARPVSVGLKFYVKL